MQKKYYKVSRAPEMEDARKLFEWAIVPLADDGNFHLLKGDPVVRIVGGTREKKHRETLK